MLGSTYSRLAISYAVCMHMHMSHGRTRSSTNSPTIQGSEAAFDFLTAYFVEDSLSVDNLFVFLLLFRYCKAPT